MVYTRSEGTGCPYCTGRKVTPKQGGLVKQFPLLAAEWDVEKNAPLTPQDVTTGSHKLIWWLCPKGHSYRSAVKTRAQGSGTRRKTVRFIQAMSLRARTAVCGGDAKRGTPTVL